VDLLYGDALWLHIRLESGRARKRHTAAACVGKDADELIQVTAGGVVVIDGTDPALRSGAPNPDAIDAWLRAGAKVFNRPDMAAWML
jgi:hypothetical protein